MRVAYVATGEFFSRYACSVQIAKNAQAWAKASDEFELLTNIGLFSWLKRSRFNLHEYHGLKTLFQFTAFPFYDLERRRVPLLKNLYCYLAAKRCKKRGVELIYTRTFSMARYAIDQGISVLVETHGPPDNSPEKLELYSQMDRPNFLALVTISEELKKRYIDFGLPEEKIMVALDGVDLERFENPLSKREARQTLDLNENKPLVMYVGHLYEDRGVKEILVAAKNFPDVNFSLIGGHEHDIEMWLERSKELNNVTFHGYMPNVDLPKFLWAADILLMPYNTYCPTAEWMSPLKLFEYMAAGRPIIGTDLPALRHVLEQGENAILVDPDSGEALSDGIDILLKDEPLQIKLGNTVLSQVQKYSWDQRVQNILENVRCMKQPPNC